MNEFNQYIIDQLTSVGFKHHSTETGNNVIIYVYKYYPVYLNGNHYNLIIIEYNGGIEFPSDHQLCIYDNDSNNAATIYHISIHSYFAKITITTQINKLFKS